MRAVLALFLILAVIAVANAGTAKPKWHQLEGYSFEEYKQHHSKIYQDRAEEMMRRDIFERNLEEVQRFNSEGSHSYKKGINHLSDRTQEELKKMRGVVKSDLFRNKGSLNSKKAVGSPFNQITSLPKTVDWRTKNVVTPVKDQGTCGSCWTFAATEVMESAYAIKTGKLLTLSEQQIIDCVANPNQCGGTGGCEGGTVEVAYAALMNGTGGLVTEKDYPYTAQDGTCQSGLKVAVTVTNYVTLPSNQMAPVMNAIATVGPVAISVDASAWQSYESGVFNGCDTASPDIDHAVVLVGYGNSESGSPYWLIRNSWGPSWGESGYIRVVRDSVCGIDTHPSDGTGCKGGPPTQKVCGSCGVLFDVAYPIVAKPN